MILVTAVQRTDAGLRPARSITILISSAHVSSRSDGVRVAVVRRLGDHGQAAHRCAVAERRLRAPAFVQTSLRDAVPPFSAPWAKAHDYHHGIVPRCVAFGAFTHEKEKTAMRKMLMTQQ